MGRDAGMIGQDNFLCSTKTVMVDFFYFSIVVWHFELKYLGSLWIILTRPDCDNKLIILTPSFSWRESLEWDRGEPAGLAVPGKQRSFKYYNSAVTIQPGPACSQLTGSLSRPFKYQEPKYKLNINCKQSSGVNLLKVRMLVLRHCQLKMTTNCLSVCPTWYFNISESVRNYFDFIFILSSGAVCHPKTSQLFICFKFSVYFKNKSSLGNADFESV